MLQGRGPGPSAGRAQGGCGGARTVQIAPLTIHGYSHSIAPCRMLTPYSPPLRREATTRSHGQVSTNATGSTDSRNGAIATASGLGVIKLAYQRPVEPPCTLRSGHSTAMPMVEK